jgi:heat shock protein HslJ
MKITPYYPLILLFALFLSACQLAPEDPGVPVTGEEPAQTLAGTQWILERIYNEPIVEGSLVTIEFEAGNGVQQLSGLSGCNTYTAEYTVDGNAIMIGEVTATEMACEEPPGVMQQEQQYLRALVEDVAAYQRSGDQLLMQDQAGETILEYKW